MNDLRKHLCSMCQLVPPVSGGYCRSCANAWHREKRNGRWGSRGEYKTIRIGNRNAKEHRFVMENHINRKLQHNEYVHHIDGDFRNNDISNLRIVSPKEHYAIHHFEAVKYGPIPFRFSEIVLPCTQVA